jgi:hypothetical protein
MPIFLIYLQEKEWDEENEEPIVAIKADRIADVIKNLSGSGKLAVARQAHQPRMLNIYLKNILGDYKGRANTVNSYRFRKLGLDKMKQIKAILKKAQKAERDSKPEDFLKNIITVSDKSFEPLGRELGIHSTSDDGYPDAGAMEVGAMGEQEEPKKKEKKKSDMGIIARSLMGKRLKTYVPGKVDAVLQMEAAIMNVSSKFVIIKHQAKRAGTHYDLRFKMPRSSNWISFAIRKGIPAGYEKRLAVRTHDHSEKEALFTGTIEDGYGAGKLTKFDSGSCKILKYDPPRSMAVEFKGSKLKGIYHFVNIAVSSGKKDFKKQNYWFFKGKQIKEAIEKIIGG